MEFDRCSVGERLFVGIGNPEALGRDRLAINGSAYVEAPMIVGNPIVFPTISATCMIGPLINPESPPPFIPGLLSAGCSLINNSPYSLAVIGDAAIFDNLDVNLNVNAGNSVKAGALIECLGDVVAFCGKDKPDRLSKKKDFDIAHPTKEGWRLTHACVEGPEAAVYFRGRITSKNEIDLPSYWKNLVDIQSITVNLTPIGSHQNVIVKRWDDSKIYLQSNGNMPIDCFYHVYAERIDTEKLIPEYEGSIEDYPGDNNQRSIVGYHYDTEN
jgi:hypothetical protein